MMLVALAASGVDYVYVAMDVLPEDLPAAVSGLGALGFRGFNVTMPHKEAILPLLDEVDEAARASGAVNTVVVEERGLRGANTDGSGFVEACGESGVGFDGAKVLVVGSGGAAIAVAVLGDGAGELRIFNRSRWRAEKLRDRLQEQYPRAAISVYDVTAPQGAAWDADVIVNATYLGMKDGDPRPLPASCLDTDTAISATRFTGSAKRPGSSGSPGGAGFARSQEVEYCSTRGSRPRGSGPAKNPTCRR